MLIAKVVMKRNTKPLSESSGKSTDGLHKKSNSESLNGAEADDLEKFDHQIGCGGESCAQFFSLDMPFLAISPVPLLDPTRVRRTT